MQAATQHIRHLQNVVQRARSATPHTLPTDVDFTHLPLEEAQELAARHSTPTNLRLAVQDSITLPRHVTRDRLADIVRQATGDPDPCIHGPIPQDPTADGSDRDNLWAVYTHQGIEPALNAFRANLCTALHQTLSSRH